MIAYIPNPYFPSVTLSKKCMLHCKHCMGRYLHQMMDIEQFKKRMSNMNINGVLISGGFNKKGELLNLRKYLPFMKKMRKKIYIAVHPGFVDEEIAEKLSASSHIAFMDIPSEKAIKNVFGLDRSTEDYLNTMHFLQDAGLKVSPHITAGLNYGKIEEWYILDELKNSPIEKLVLNFILPTARTPFENVRIDKDDAIEFFKEARKKIKKITIGCMRPRYLDIPLIEAGAEEMANPSPEARKYLHNDIKEIRWCCGISREEIHLIEKNRKEWQQ